MIYRKTESVVCKETGPFGVMSKFHAMGEALACG